MKFDSLISWRLVHKFYQIRKKSQIVHVLSSKVTSKGVAKSFALTSFYFLLLFIICWTNVFIYVKVDILCSTLAFLVLELWFPFHFLLPVKKKKLYISVCLNIEFYVALIFSRGISISKFGDRLDILIGFLNFRLEYKSGILISDRNYFSF